MPDQPHRFENASNYSWKYYNMRKFQKYVTLHQTTTEIGMDGIQSKSSTGHP